MCNYTIKNLFIVDVAHVSGSAKETVTTDSSDSQISLKDPTRDIETLAESQKRFPSGGIGSYFEMANITIKPCKTQSQNDDSKLTFK